MKIIIGSVVGRLTVIARGEMRGTNRYWICACLCGVVKPICGGNLLQGTSSCGCLRSENKASVTHGQTKTSEYLSWQDMKQRCFNPKRKKYPRYGGRGITVCDRWVESFENFYTDMGPKPSRKYSIERKNNDGNYEPSNCRWATNKEQAQNRCNTLTVQYQGTVRPLKEVCERLNLNYSKVYGRLFVSKWPVERALT